MSREAAEFANCSVCAASLKSREATEAPQTGWSLTRKCFKTHSETSRASDHPVRAFSEQDHILDGAATLLCKKGNMPATKAGLVSIFLLVRSYSRISNLLSFGTGCNFNAPDAQNPMADILFIGLPPHNGPSIGTIAPGVRIF